MTMGQLALGQRARKAEDKAERGRVLLEAAKGLRGSMEKHGIEVLETTDAMLGGRKAKRLVYAHRLETAKGEADVKAVIYIVLRNDWVYALDIRATEKTYDAFLPIAQKVIDSLKWIQPEAGDKSKETKPAPKDSPGN